jgi:predicted Rossmann fold flavoprotein
MYDVVIIGGGPSGVFAAIQAKNINTKAKIMVLEKSSSILSKVKVAGGGRCNVTNATFDIIELCKNYPRGKRELVSAFNKFSPRDMMQWLNSKGVKLTVDKDRKVFPSDNCSQTIIDCLLKEIKNKNVEVRYNQNIVTIQKNKDLFEIVIEGGEKFITKKVVLATGSSSFGVKCAKQLGHSIDPFIPSLFSFKIEKEDILQLSGLSHDVTASLKNSLYKQAGSILITHEGFTGPSVINLSSMAATYLFEKKYHATLVINWLKDASIDQIIQLLLQAKNNHPKKKMVNINVFNLPQNLWSFFLSCFGTTFSASLINISNKNMGKLANKLFSDEYKIISKSRNKSEFVSCGGVSLKEVNFKDMQSKICNNLYIVGELLNIDGITGGYNLQNAWTTGFIAGSSV